MARKPKIKTKKGKVNNDLNSSISKNQRLISRMEQAEKEINYNQKVVTILCRIIFILTVLILLLLVNDMGVFETIFMVALTVWLFYFAWLRNFIYKYKSKCKIILEVDAVLFSSPLLGDRRNKYEEWAQSVAAGHFKVGSRGFEYRLGMKKIVFYYNVGLTNARHLSEIQHEYFRKLLVKADQSLDSIMPVFSNANIDKLDKRASYHTSRMLHYLYALLDIFMLFLLSSIGGIAGIALVAVACGLTEAFVFYFSIKGAYFNYKNEMALRKALPDNTGIVRDNGLGAIRPYLGYIAFAVIFLSTFISEFLIIWM